MTRHLIVLANPAPQSFDHALADAYAREVEAQGQEVRLRDLNALGFDPVLKAAERPGGQAADCAKDVSDELAELEASGVLVLVYPIWFGGPPAILKGYVDRVLGADYDFRHFHDRAGQPRVRGKWLLSISTSGTPLPWLDENGQTLALRQGFDVYLERGFGLRDLDHVRIDNVMPNMSHAYAASQIERVRDAARRACEVAAKPH
ncbi:MAG: NAD(P)H-dependent oxidoreductase [Sphingomonas sp.]